MYQEGAEAQIPLLADSSVIPSVAYLREMWGMWSDVYPHVCCADCCVRLSVSADSNGKTNRKKVMVGCG